MTRKIFVLLSDNEKNNAKAIALAVSIRKALEKKSFPSITAISIGGKDAAYALACGFDEAVVLETSKSYGSSEKLSLSALVATKCGRPDIIVSSYGLMESRAIAFFLGISVFQTENEISFDEIYFDLSETCINRNVPIVICPEAISVPFGSECFIAIASVIQAGYKPDYVWNETDLGEDIDCFIQKNVLHFRKEMESNPKNNVNVSSGEKRLSPQKESPEKTAMRIYDLIEKKIALDNCNCDMGRKKLVFGGGMGLGKHGFCLLREAAYLAGAKIAATRPAVQAGYTPSDCLVGQSGHTVETDIYVAFGVSGAVLHMCGIKSGCVIAVNTDSNAEIFRLANEGFVCDATVVLENLCKILSDRKINVKKTL